MKPCAKNRPSLTWLALGELTEPSARELRAHVAACPGCRQYLAEISRVSGQLAANPTNPALAPSAAFHRELMAKINAAPKASSWAFPWSNWQLPSLGWPVAVGLAAVVLLLLQRPAWQWFPFRQPVPSVRLTQTTPSQVDPEAGLEPTLANYQRAAGESLDSLDNLLARQEASRGPAEPVVTAAMGARSF
jgi:predicted anti-sigma-YlaC factor YlaD